MGLPSHPGIELRVWLCSWRGSVTPGQRCSMSTKNVQPAGSATEMFMKITKGFTRMTRIKTGPPIRVIRNAATNGGDTTQIRPHAADGCFGLHPAAISSSAMSSHDFMVVRPGTIRRSDKLPGWLPGWEYARRERSSRRDRRSRAVC